MVELRAIALVLVAYGLGGGTVRCLSSLYSPTQFYKLTDNVHIIVDCWNNRLLYTTSFSVDNPGCIVQKVPTITPLQHPHSVASNGVVMLVESTEAHQVIVIKHTYDPATNEASFVEIQAISDVGERPHYTIYNEERKKFFVLGAFSQSLHVLEWDEASQQVVSSGEMQFPSELGYIRSFALSGDKFYFGPSEYMPYFLEWTISFSGGEVVFKNFRALPFSIDRFQREGVEYFYYNNMLIVNKTLWISFYAEHGQVGPFFESYDIIQTTEFTGAADVVFVNRTEGYLSPHLSSRISRASPSEKPFTPYYFTHFDGRIYMGLIHLRSGIYSWPENGNPELSGVCHFCS